MNDHAIQMDDFAIELLNAPSIKRGFQALYNHYASPSTTRIFKKCDASHRQSTTKTGRTVSSLYRSNGVARPSEIEGSKKYRASSDQGSDEVNVELWLNAFRTLDARDVGRIEATHVQLLLNRIGRTVPSEDITDWVNRIGTGSHGKRQVTLIEILAGWSSVKSSGSTGALIVDNRPSSRSNSPLPSRSNSRSNSRVNSRVNSRAQSRTNSRATTPLFLNMNRSPTSSMSGSMNNTLLSSSFSTQSTAASIAPSSSSSSSSIKRQGRFIGVDVGDFLECMTDFGICPDLLPISACRAIFTKRIASSLGASVKLQIATPAPRSSASRSFKSSLSPPSLSSTKGVLNPKRLHLDAVRRAGLSAISANCETFVALLCDVAHVGFGTYPYDASVSTFGEKMLVLLWRMQQHKAGIQYIGLRTNTLTGGDTTLFGTLPETAPTSMDALRRIRREKRPDLALKFLGRKMDTALPHERSLWAKASSPRSPGLMQGGQRNKKKILPLDARKPSTFGNSPRKGDYEERVRKRRVKQQMSLNTGYNGKSK